MYVGALPRVAQAALLGGGLRCASLMIRSGRCSVMDGTGAAEKCEKTAASDEGRKRMLERQANSGAGRAARELAELAAERAHRAKQAWLRRGQA